MERRPKSLRRLRGAEREAHARRAIERWQASGESLAAFCRSEGIAPVTLHRWRREFGRTAGASPVRFVSVDVAMARDAGSFELDLGEGRRLRVPAGFAERDLERLLAVLGGKGC
jgi:hypothetical protein